MVKKLLITFALIIILFLMSPMFMYWWGLSQIDGLGKPVDLNLTQDEKNEIWIAAREVGKPRLRKLNPYSYLLMVNCGVNCRDRFPGSNITAQAIRAEVSSQLNHGNNTHWQFTWMAYTIWATNNWSLDEVVSTYKSTRA
ncbi:hypothetical protein ACJJIR_07585 [Microbulbifer sp. SSSA008]|uniref:hypothetical protein n=1 Tax=Microbulbifer sp. SSSA008 TaxID=3243380 RepID=UPI00403992C1